MPVYHRTQRLQIFGEKPEIQKLYGSRYRMVVRCVAKNDTKAWYDDNKSQIFADFGSLYSAQMSVDGIDARTGEAYDDMVLVKNEATYTRSGEYVIIFTYETLTDSFVQETEDKVDFDLNGLKRLTRTIIAKDTVAYSSVVGTSTTGTSPVLTLAQVSEDQLEASEDGFKRIQEVWLESGTLSETIDNVGSQKAKVIETIGADPATPTGYSLASKQESDFEGFQTNRFTFLKNNVILSESKDKVGSQESIVQEVFNGTPDTPGGYSVASKQESDVEGIPTKRFTFLKDNVILSESEDKVGSQLAIVKEVFNGTPDTPGGYSIASKQESDVDGIPTKRFTFLKDGVVLSESEDKVGSQLAITQEVFNGTPATPGGYSIASEQKSDVDGIPTRRYTFLKDGVILSESEDEVGSQNAIIQEVFNGTPETPGGHIVANKQESDVDGIPTKRYTFLKDNVVLSESEDKVGSQLAIVQEVFNGTPSTPSGYSIANTQESDVDGIPTKRYTFLKDDVQLSQTEDKVGSQLAISQQWFNPNADKTLAGYSLASKNTSDFEGIETVEYRFLKNNAELSRSSDLVGSQKAIVTEVFKPSADPTETGYSVARTEVSDVDGIPTKRFTFLKNDVKLSASEDEIGSQNAITEQWFKPSALRDTKASYSLARKEESDVGGIPTERYTFLKDDVELSRSSDLVGSQKAITVEIFKPDSDPTEAGYSVARTEVSDVEGIPTKRYTFLRDNVELIRSNDYVGSQKAITREFFNPTSDPTESGYSLASQQQSDFEGIKTIRYVFLKEDVKLSASEDKVGSQNAITEQWFKPGASRDTKASYSVARTEVSDVDGIPTKRFTFLKDNVKLSESEDKVGSQLATTQEWFNPTDDPTITDYSIANTQVSDVDGIPTKRYTFLRDDVLLSETEDKVGSQLAIVQERFNPSEEPTIAEYIIANTQESDIGGIPTKRFTFLKDNVELSRSSDLVGSQKAIVTEVFKPTSDPTETGYSVARTEVSDVEGIPTKRFTFLKEDVELSRSEDKVGSQLAITTEVFKPTSDPTESGYSVARTEVSDLEGIPTKRFTFLKDNVELSRSEDKVGSQLAITTEVFKPDADPTEEGYSVARTEVSDVEGIPTKRFTFLKDNVILSVTQDKVGSQESIINEVFNPDTYDFDGVDEDNVTLTGYVEASRQASDFEGIETVRYTFLKEDVKLSASEDKVGSQNAIVEEWFKPESGRETKSDYSLARKEESDVEGIPTERYTFLKDNVELSRSEDLVGSQLAITTEVFKPDADPTEAGYSLARTEVSDVEGIPTKRFTFLKDNVELSRSEDKVGSQLAITTQVFKPTFDPTETGYSVARTEVSDVEGIPTKRFTLLKDNVELFRSEDLVSSQNAIVTEVFKPTSDPTEAGYSLARTEVSDVDGIPTERYTFLKENVELFRSEDLVSSQNAIVTEVFKPDDDPTEEGYSLARTEVSDVDGIPTKRYTFLKENVELSRSEDKVGSQLAITTEIFKPSADPVEAGYSVARTEVSDVDGIPTKRFTFLKNNVVLSVSEDKVGSQKAVVNEVFNPTSEAITGIDTSGTELTEYSEANRTESDYEGIKTIRVQFLKDNVVLSRSIQTKSGGKLILEVVEVFNGTPVAETTGAVKIGDEVSDVDGIPTRRFTFAKGAGTIRTSTRPGRIDGTTEVTVISYGTEVTPTGTIISSSQEEEDGYIQYVNTAIQGTITGTKQTYKDVVQVEVPGTVSCTTVSVSSGGVSGTIAVPQVTPRKRKTIAATVTVEVLTTPTNTASIAYDLGSISCSVTSTNTSLTVGPGSTVTVGTTSVVSDTGYVQNFGASARIQTYPGCYLTTSSSTGLVSYITSSQPVANGNVISRDNTDSTRQTKCIGTGSTSATGYSTTGVIRRNSRLIVTALDGTTYYEVITWSV